MFASPASRAGDLKCVWQYLLQCRLLVHAAIGPWCGSSVGGSETHQGSSISMRGQVAVHLC